MIHIKLFVASALAMSALLFCSCSGAKAEDSAPFEAYWSVENLEPDSTGRHYKQTIRLTGDLRGVSRLAFSQFARRMQLDNDADTLIEIVPGYYAIGSERFAGATGADTIDIGILTNGAIHSIRYAPEGFHAVMADGRVLPVPLVQADITARRSGYASGSRDYMPYGDEIYDRNEEIIGGTSDVYDIVPSFKSVTRGEGSSTVDLDKVEFRQPDASDDFKPEEYRIFVSDGRMTVVAPKEMWSRLRLRLRHAFGTGHRVLPDAEIVDYPSMPYRGLMIDIARNFQSAKQMHRVLDHMATYGLNVLHFHLVDDEGWRLEIPSLPELAEVGSRRGYHVALDGTGLPQFFGGDGRSDSKTSNNGYISRDEYIGLLRHADSLGIAVIPEIESPGHARASIKAMELRARRTGDASWLLQEPADTSVYTSAQSFHDNVMNPALEGPYRLMGMVADDIADMYAEAGVRLPAIHIGGDEVPRGAWGGSPAVNAMKERLGVENDKEIHAAFVKRVASDFAAKGIAVSGWQEIAYRHDAEYDSAVVPEVYSVNCWRTMSSHGNGTVVDEVASAGYPVVLSNADHFYFDLCYNRHPYERGLTWGGTTDEFSALSGYPARLCTAKDARVLGVQGQVWSETIRDAGHLETMLFPKMLGLAERGWNPDSTYSERDFHAVIVKEIPKWERDNIAYHVRQPGVKIVDGRFLHVNSPYPDGVVRLTFDGNEPSEDSPEFKGGSVVNLEEFSTKPTQIRARLWLNGHPSVTTILNVDLTNVAESSRTE